MENIAGRVVVHVAQLANVPVKRGYAQLTGAQHRARFFERPREVVAVVV